MSFFKQAVSPIEAANIAGVRGLSHPVITFTSDPASIRDWMVSGDPDFTARCRAENPSASNSFMLLLVGLKISPTRKN